MRYIRVATAAALGAGVAAPRIATHQVTGAQLRLVALCGVGLGLPKTAFIVRKVIIIITNRAHRRYVQQ